MPLVNLKTDLTSLKYGNDKPGGGDSGQPFIVANPDGGVNTSVGPSNILRILGINSIPAIPNLSTPNITRRRIGQVINQILTNDTFIRGGALGAAQASLNDFFRIGAYLTTLPKGPLFIAKQVGLQLSNPRLEVKKGVRGAASGIFNPGNLLGTLTGGALGPTRIYNLGINTIAQVPLNAFGGHIIRHGILPVQSDDTKYEAVVTFNNESTNSKDNRLIGLTKKFELGDRQYEASRRFNLSQARRLNRQANRAGRQATRAQNAVAASQLATSLLGITGPQFIPFLPKFKRTKLDTTKLTIDSYIGGPKSLYGVGLTIINRYNFTEDYEKITEAFNNSYAYAGQSRKLNDVSNPNYIDSLGKNNRFQSVDYSINAYGNEIPTSSLDITPALIQGSYQNYFTLRNNIKDNITQNIPFVDVSGSAAVSGSYPLSNYKNSISTQPNPVDKIAPNFKYYGAGVKSASNSKITYNNTDTFARQDSTIMSVLFRSVNPFGQSIPDPDRPGVNENEERWIFPAYMTGYKDDFNASWNETNYVGRAESFFIYSKFKRNVNFNLKIPCFNKDQLFEKHRALGQLASVTAGSYKQTNNGSALGGVLLKVNVGNYLVGEYAVLNNISFSIPDEASWDVSSDALLSMYIDASFSLTIVHKNLPRYEQSSKTALDNGFFGYLPNPVNSVQAQPAGFITPTAVVNYFTKN